MLLDPYIEELENLEQTRNDDERDWKAYSLGLSLVGFLLACTAIAFIFSLSLQVFALCVVFAACEIGLWWFRSNLGSAYRERFRDSITRVWFREKFDLAFLVRTLSSDEAAIAFARRWPAAGKITISERVLFDRDSFNTELYIVKQSDWMAGSRRLCVWRQPRVDDHKGCFAIADRSRGLKRLFSVPFYRVYPGPQPLKTDVDQAQGLITEVGRIVGARRVQIDLRPDDVWLAVDLLEDLFPTPFHESCLEENSYLKWPKHAELLLSESLRQGLSRLR
jgi:hypothetical protein